MAKAKIIVADDRGAFTERAMAVKDALESMGHSSVIDNWKAEAKFGGLPIMEQPLLKDASNHELNIYINGYKVIPDRTKTNICIQTEQLDLMGYDKFDPDNWDLVLDLFSAQARGGRWRYFAMGYSERFDAKDIHEVEPDDRLYFFGCMTPYRARLAEKFGIKTGVHYGRRRDEMIMASKAVIFMHYCPAVRFRMPPFRFLLAACKGRAYFQEATVDGSGIYDEMCIPFTEDGMENVLKVWNDRDLMKYAEQIKTRLIYEQNFTQNFKTVTKGVLW